MLNSYDTNFDSPTAHIDNLFLFGVLRPNKYVMNVTTKSNRNRLPEMQPNPLKDRAMHEGENLSF
jgi:hypothetical protein